MQIKVPNLGDGVSSAQVLEVLVSEGDLVKKDDTLLELETDKAVAPVPATEDGVVTSILVKVGDSVQTGTVICDLESGNNKGITKSSFIPSLTLPLYTILAKFQGCVGWITFF